MSTDLDWFKSSYSSGQGGECLEVALTPTTVHIRDSKTTGTASPALHVAPSTWAAFLAALA
ncbi:DUF397 domain-containing protein [Streptomyces sp. NPDC020489]|uniref:DUF397 domain-containing protein n=1 Tax=Streptomyces sp. NPDC020489 TaxID=3365077 RepID=UPI0037B8BB53